ncbi:MAG TPA: DUF1206 domain-containing protein [Actinotalea sp.]|nr:DUF1206 domain-containing protein [Actinotalea sp.]
MATSARATARRAGDHPVLATGARLGYAANGVLNLVLAWLALQLVLGGSGESTDQTGALRQLAGTPIGGVLLWVVLAGFALLALWQLTEAVSASGRDRLKPAAKAVVYAVLATTAASVLQGSAGDGSEQAEGLTARVLQQPLGVWLVAAVGLAVVAVGLYHVHKGVRARFLRDLRTHPHSWVVRAGRVGYVARGAALGVVGALFVTAALNHDPERTGGLDEALTTLLEAPAGAVLVAAVAVGFACYGVYSFARARYAAV